MASHSCCGVVVLFMTGCGTGIIRGATSLAAPIDPVNAIRSAFATHDVVALDEGDHGLEQGHAFRLALLRDSRLPHTVRDPCTWFAS